MTGASAARDFDGKTAIVTGASSGIGREYARSLARGGASIALAGRSTERLQQLAAELECETITVSADIAEPGAAELITRSTLERFGRLDIVMSNAGIYFGGSFAEVDPAAMHTMIGVNVYGAMAMVRAALPHLTAQSSGDVIVTSSVSGHQDLEWEPIYSATKNAIQTFVHTVRRQLAGTGVRVGAIAPGVVLNELWGYVDAEERVEEEVRFARGIRSEDVADAAMFMLSRPRHVTIRDLVILPSAQQI